jgi:hypothetical protein
MLVSQLEWLGDPDEKEESTEELPAGEPHDDDAGRSGFLEYSPPRSSAFRRARARK